MPRIFSAEIVVINRWDEMNYLEDGIPSEYLEVNP